MAAKDSTTPKKEDNSLTVFVAISGFLLILAGFLFTIWTNASVAETLKFDITNLILIVLLFLYVTFVFQRKK